MQAYNLLSLPMGSLVRDMIAEPYICIKGKHEGVIEWFEDPDGICFKDRDIWKPYVDFEREKLKELGAKHGITIGTWGFCIMKKDTPLFDVAYNSKELGYTVNQYLNDSESSRLLKRAEFLREVCRKEDVPWLTETTRCLPSSRNQE